MGTISYTVPVAGTDLNSVADPEVATALTTLLTWANGNVDTNNLSSTAAIKRSQLAGALGALAYSAVTTNTNAADGNLYLTNAAGLTITLPTPTAGVTIAVFNGAGTPTSPTTITASSGTFAGGGLGGASSFVLGALYASVILVGNGTNWLLFAGSQDTGWIELTVVSPVTQSSNPASYRIVNDRVWFKGVIQNVSGGSIGAGTNLVTGLPEPPVIRWPTVGFTSGGAGTAEVTTGGILGLPVTFGNGTAISFDSSSYSLS